MLTPGHARKNGHDIRNMITICGAGLRLDLEEQKQTPQHFVEEQKFCMFEGLILILLKLTRQWTRKANTASV